MPEIPREPEQAEYRYAEGDGVAGIDAATGGLDPGVQPGRRQPLERAVEWILEDALKDPASGRGIWLRAAPAATPAFTRALKQSPVKSIPIEALRSTVTPSDLAAVRQIVESTDRALIPHLLNIQWFHATTPAPSLTPAPGHPRRPHPNRSIYPAAPLPSGAAARGRWQ